MYMYMYMYTWLYKMFYLDTIEVNSHLFSIFHPFLMDSQIKKLSQNDVTKIDTTDFNEENTTLEKPTKSKVNDRF